MCKVVAVRHVEDCFDGGFVKEFEIDVALDERVMRSLSEDARLQYFPEFPRPYFRIQKPDVGVIQGVLGNKRFRVTFSRVGRERGVAWIESRVETSATLK